MQRQGSALYRIVTTIAFLVIAGAALMGCNRDEESKTAMKAGAPGTPSTAASAAAGTPTNAPKLTPAQAWATDVVACYETALKDCVAALAGTPPAADVLPKLKAIEAKTIEKLVPLGRQREAMEKPVRAQADNAFASKLMGQQSADYFKTYYQLMMGPYSRGKAKTDSEKEAAEVLFGMNVITQYAQFEVLKKQLPKEAARLGIQ